MKRFRLVIIGFLSAASLRAEEMRFALPLHRAEETALERSPRLAASRSDAASAHERAATQGALLWPALSLEGSWRYVAEVPSLTVGGKSLTLGDRRNYSIGPEARWALWDSGLRQGRRGAAATAAAKDADARATRAQILLAARSAYFQTQGAQEQARLLAESLRLAQSQYADIQRRVRSGAASRLDGLSAHQEVLTRRAQLRQARADLGAALRDLTALTGDTIPDGDLMPLDADTARNLPAEVEPPAVVLALDSLDDSESALPPVPAREPEAGRHPRVESWARAADAARFAGRAAAAGRQPRIEASAKTSLDYPNGPVLERINQKTAGVTASWPIFEFNRVAHDVRAQEEQARALDALRDQAERDLRRDWADARDQYDALSAERAILRQRAEEAKELARLVYESYRAGQSRYLDVQSANVRALEAEIQRARAQIQLLTQKALLAALSEGD